MAKPFVTHVLWSLGRGGAERLVLDVARHLPEHGFNVRVLAAGGGGEMEKDFAAAGVPVIVNPRAGTHRAALSFLREDLSRHRPTVWHTHLEQIWSGLAGRSVFMRPWVATAHGLEDSFAWPMRLARAMAFRRADHVVCVSEAVRARLRAVGGVRAGRSSVIPPGIDLDRFRPREPRLAGDVPELLSVSRLVPGTGLDVLLEALSGVLRPWRLTIVGDGPEMPAVRRQAEVLGILPRIRFAGSVADPSSFYRHADVFCFPSRSEGQGIAMFEAAACHLPAIASDLPAVREAFGDDAVAFVAPGDADAWRQAIERTLARYPEALARATRAASIVTSRYSLAATVQAHADLYRKLLGKGKM